MAKNILALGTSTSFPVEGNPAGTKYVMGDNSDENGLVITAHCVGYAGTVTTTAAIYQIGCTLVETDRGSMYVNVGTTAVPSFFHIAGT